VYTILPKVIPGFPHMPTNRPGRPCVPSVQAAQGPKFWGAHKFYISLMLISILGKEIRSTSTWAAGHDTCPRPAGLDADDPADRLSLDRSIRLP
jgi:hypothetical protein